MTASELIRFSAAAALIAAAAVSTDAEACSRRASGSVYGFEVLPANAAVVPRSTLIWAHKEGVAQRAGTDGSIRLVDSAGAVVPTDETVISVSGEATESVLVLRPRALLDPNKAYEVQVDTSVVGLDAGGGYARVSVFSTNNEIDTEAPAAPTATVKTVTASHFGLYSCGNPSSVELTLGKPADIAFLLTVGQTIVPQPPSALAAGSGTSLLAVNLSPGAQSFDLVEFDLSGNGAGSSTGAVSVTVPAQTSGCSTAGAFPMLALALLALRRRS